MSCWDYSGFTLHVICISLRPRPFGLHGTNFRVLCLCGVYAGGARVRYLCAGGAGGACGAYTCMWMGMSASLQPRGILIGEVGDIGGADNNDMLAAARNRALHGRMQRKLTVTDWQQNLMNRQCDVECIAGCDGSMCKDNTTIAQECDALQREVNQSKGLALTHVTLAASAGLFYLHAVSILPDSTNLRLDVLLKSAWQGANAQSILLIRLEDLLATGERMSKKCQHLRFPISSIRCGVS